MRNYDDIIYYAVDLVNVPDTGELYLFKLQVKVIKGQRAACSLQFNKTYFSRREVILNEYLIVFKGSMSIVK